MKEIIAFSDVKRVFIGVVILISIGLTVALVVDIVFFPNRVKQPDAGAPQDTSTLEEEKIPAPGPPLERGKKKTDGLKEKTDKILEPVITYEVFENVDPQIIEEEIPYAKDEKPEIAIIIDDIGYDWELTMALRDLDPNITFSVLPFAPFSRLISDKLHKKGTELMLHLPMEPVEYPGINPGPGALLSQMSPDVLLDQLQKNIQDVPHVVGVNNHMGSKITANSDQMNQIFTIFKKEKLFFVDSITAKKSQCKSAARLFKVKFAQRDVFLDNFQNADYIIVQLKRLVDLARRRGTAIGIAHPYEATLEVLSKELPKVKKEVDIVRASRLTYVPD